ncbi:MAG: MBL fold metallo-hydrolase [Gemmatimonadetes bacterium]|uniref:MBL fold metallo-hydrolase n=1 Tax=Candidatus Kutchimonas denitrificans TaxID=3056748 RepID=A0AAE4Z6W7_9BACT|nr:MBL fold metallo-hydrolase [Gemmatimonadota bacterium]NIR73567.1 MBL fold metallo-hydrolase [Candidatus Kutchimonas denitrificans]NIR99526.1 MBL fold metallo-hydrolase [Gemmatimonadota bacterium]NIT65146.1 MBL fold metallo-hydrolase [Gemmatimonadota bacterium]NIV23679.1 MBL fold metallo-hydrolase [Gemmatimonadota bacterium]
MLFERFEDRGLAHYSYAVGCKAAGQLAIVDPRRDVDEYVRYAESQSSTITHVLETHIHADFASGARELAERTGAKLLVSGHDDGETYEVTFPHEDVRDGDVIELGTVRIEALHTPGHTPEHLSFLVYDGARSREVPELLLSGDFLFVGSLGRPDLLGEEAKRGLAESMYRSVREKINSLPDGLEVHPAHGAGSMCGSGMSGRASSTLGYERATNPYLQDLDEAEFVERLLGDVPPFPPYYRRMKRVNSERPAILGSLPGQRPIGPVAFRSQVEKGHVVIDLRDQLAFGGGHIAGSFGIGFDPDLSQWAAWVVPYDTPILLVVADAAHVAESVRRLVRVGLDDVRGYLAGGMDAWLKAGYPLAEIGEITPGELHERLAAGEPIEVLDVRTEEEYRGGHIEGARHIMGGWLPERTEELPTDRSLATICATGYRSTVAASVLQRAGFQDVINVAGGMTAWRQANLAVQ